MTDTPTSKKARLIYWDGTMSDWHEFPCVMEADRSALFVEFDSGQREKLVDVNAGTRVRVDDPEDSCLLSVYVMAYDKGMLDGLRASTSSEVLREVCQRILALEKLLESSGESGKVDE